MPLRSYFLTWAAFFAVPVYLMQVNLTLGLFTLLSFAVFLIFED